MTMFQKVLTFYGQYKKAVHAEAVALTGWGAWMLNSGHWPPSRPELALLLTLLLPGPVTAATSNVPKPEPVVPEPLVPAFPVAAPLGD